jgi:hypothetical protein
VTRYADRVEEPEQQYEFDVALSYASEDRSYVHEVAKHLQANGVRVFYDEFFTAELWGQDLYVYLDTVYGQRSRFTVIFISRSYVAKPWPSHERQSAQARALNELGPYLLPVRFDDSLLPGLRPTVSYIDASRVTPEQLARLVIDKLADTPGTLSPVPTVVGVPRTAKEQRQLLSQRPPAWEFLFYASVLLQRRADVEEKWRDHELHYAPRTGKHVGDGAAVEYLSSAVDEVMEIVGGINRVLDSDAQDLAFGAPGEPGSPERIEHLATRLIGVYEELLDWARGLRGIGVSSELRNIFELTARLADLPVQQIRDMVDYYVAEVERIPEQLRRGEAVHLEMTLKLDMDPEASSEFVNELKNVEKIVTGA